jgi:GT2 family glycosyltransferase
VWVDAHVEPPQGWAAPFLALLERPEVGAVGPAVSVMGNESSVGYGMHWRSARLEVGWLSRPAGEHVPVPMLGGCFLAMRRKVFEHTGGFDDGLILWGGTDVELCFRLWTLGLECHLVPQVIVAHLFRRRFPYPVEAVTVLHNLLRIAFVHFDEDRILRVVEARRSDLKFPEALARVVSSDAWARRDELRRRRVIDDDAVFARFPMPGLSDEASRRRPSRSSARTGGRAASSYPLPQGSYHKSARGNA